MLTAWLAVWRPCRWRPARRSGRKVRSRGAVVGDRAPARGEPRLRIVLFGLGHVGATMAACRCRGRPGGDPRDRPRPGRGRRRRVRPSRRVREPGLDALLRRGDGGPARRGDGAGRPAPRGWVRPGLRRDAPEPTGGGSDLSALRDVTCCSSGAAISRPTAGSGAAPDRLPQHRAAGHHRGRAAAAPGRGRGRGAGAALRGRVQPGIPAPGQRRRRLPAASRGSPLQVSAGRSEPAAGRPLRSPDRTLARGAAAVAEPAKLVDNGWHALKVAFANEVGRAPLRLRPRPAGGDGGPARRRRAQPRCRLPASRWPYGGSCLPKDLAALLAHAGMAELSLPVLEGVGRSNALHLAWLAGRVRARLPPPAWCCSSACRTSSRYRRPAPQPAARACADAGRRGLRAAPARPRSDAGVAARGRRRARRRGPAEPRRGLEPYRASAWSWSASRSRAWTRSRPRACRCWTWPVWRVLSAR